MHSYFHCDPYSSSVYGIGNDYLDANDEFKDKSGGLGLSESTKVNRIYTSPSSKVQINTSQYKVQIQNVGLPDTVVWNPEPEDSFIDLGEPYFICVESGLITKPKTLEPHSEWSGNVIYEVLVN